MFSLRHLRYFLAAAEKGQISLAAASLNVSQSTVTTSLQQLERDLGHTLFRRLPGGVELTAEGSRFLTRARDVLEAVERAERASLTEAAPVAGLVRLGVTPTLAAYVMPQPLARFRRLFPGVEVALWELSAPEIAEGVAAERLDCGVAGVWPAHDGLAFEPLLSSRRRLWVSAEHPLAAAPEVALGQLANANLLVLAADGEHEAIAPVLNGARGAPGFASSSVEALRSMVALGLGVALLPDLFYRPFSLEGRRVEPRPVSGPVPPLELRLGYARARKVHAAAQAFADFLIRAAGGGLGSL